VQLEWSNSAGPLRVTSPIKHVVIIVKENHGYDNYFGPFPGGSGVTLPHSPNPPPKDPNHRHAAWLTRDTTAAHVQFQEKESGVTGSTRASSRSANNYYTDVAGPSTPNHLMLIMADSPLIDNPTRSYRTKPGPALYDQPSLPAQLDAAGLSWGNYAGYAFEFIKYTAGKQRRWQQFAAGRRRGEAAHRVVALRRPGVQRASRRHAGRGARLAPATSPKAASGREPGAGHRPRGTLDAGCDLRHVGRLGCWWDHVTPPEVEKWPMAHSSVSAVVCRALSSALRAQGPHLKGAALAREHRRFCEVTFG